MAKYEVFISFKNTDKFGRRTRDSEMAEALYYALEKNQVTAFYSNVSLHKNGQSEFVDAIDQALEESRILVAVGSCRENLETGWVKNEIKQFRADMYNGNKGQGQSALISYITPDFSPNNLPSGLRQCESFTDLNMLVNFILNFRKKGSGFVDQQAASNRIGSGMFFPGSVIDNRYRILKEIGRGGFSCVYLAEEILTERKLAVKVVRRDSATRMHYDEFRETLLDEALLMKRLNHPCIPRIYDIIDIPESVAIVMELVIGSPLSVKLQKGPLPQADVISIARSLGDVLHYLHTREEPIIYRDLKPANIIRDFDGRITLLDFGTARRYREDVQTDTVCLGTLGYAAPEQYGGLGQTDARTDIYGLGTTLHHLITGQQPSLSQKLVPIHILNPNLSRGFSYIIEKCTEKDPDQRFQTVEEFLKALDNMNRLGIREKRFDFFRKLISGNKKQDEHTRETQRRRPEEPGFVIPGAATAPSPPVAPPVKFGETPGRENLFETTVLQGPVTEVLGTDIGTDEVLTENLQQPFVPSPSPTENRQKIEDLTVKVSGMQAILSDQVFGQDHAVREVVSGYFHSALLGGHRQDRVGPRAAYLFVGPPGAGKKYLAKSFARVLKVPFTCLDPLDYIQPDDMTDSAAERQLRELVEFIRQTPKCVVLFEGLEKTQRKTLRLLIQMLDGTTDLNGTGELSLQDTILIVSTTAGSGFLAEKSAADPSCLSRKQILLALEADVDPESGKCRFPEPVRMRFEHGNVVLLRAIPAADLRNILKQEMTMCAEGFEQEFSIRVQIAEDVFTALLLSEGGGVNAGNICCRGREFFTGTIAELLQAINAAKLPGDISGMERICMETTLSREQIYSLYADDAAPEAESEEVWLQRIMDESARSHRRLTFRVAMDVSEDGITAGIRLQDFALAENPE